MDSKSHYVFLLVGLFALTNSCLAQERVKNMNYDFAPLDSTINTWVSKSYYPGASIIIVKDDKVAFEKYYGNYTSQTEVYIASAGKWLAAAAIATVVDKTDLSWNDPVEKWLPEFKGDPKGKILLRQLLSHTSGIRNYHQEPKRDTYNQLDSAVADILPLDTVFTAGSRFEYGGLAMQVAGRMAEVASGMDFESIFQKNICTPLGMNNTHFTPVDLGGGHSPMLGGGARTVLQDYINFLNMIYHYGLFNGKQIVSKESIKEMQADQVKGAKVYPGEYVEKGLGLYHTSIYGLGEWREKIDENGDAYQISSLGWAGAYPWINKHDGVYGFFLTHVQGENMRRDGVSSFYGSPIISELTSAIVNNKAGIKQGRINIGDASLYYEEAGKGIPVVLLHAHSVDCRMWNAQFKELSKYFRVIRYDFRGYGLSSVPVEGRDFKHAEDLHKLMITLGIKKAHLVGLSLGALTITDYLTCYPEEVLSATFVAGGWSGANYREEPTKEFIPLYKEHWKAAMKEISCLVSDLTQLIALIDGWKAWQPQHHESPVFFGETTMKYYQNKKVQTPSLFIVGEFDSKESKQASVDLSKLIPDSKMVIIKNAGHFSNIEQPKVFTNILLFYLNSKILKSSN